MPASRIQPETLIFKIGLLTVERDQLEEQMMSLVRRVQELELSKCPNECCQEGSAEETTQDA